MWKLKGSAAPARRLRILHLVSGDLWAGAEVQVYQLLRAAQSERSLEIRAVLLNPGVLASRLSADSVDVMVLDETHQSFPSLARSVIKLAREWRPAVIHTHRRKEHLLGALAARPSGARVVGTIHGRGEFQHSRLNARQKILRGAETLALSRFHDKLVMVTDELATELPYPESKTVVIPNGIDVEVTREAAAHACAALGDDGRVNIGFLGRLVPVKQVDHMIQMMALLEEADPGRYMLHIVGDGPLRNELEQLSRSLGLEGAIRFHGFSDNPMPLLARMDLFLFASAHEGLPMSALESLALGVQIVAPPIGSLSRLISESGRGRTADSDSPAALADAVASIPRHSSIEWPRPSILPDRYRIENCLRATVRLWRDVAGRSAQ
jgi:L-malate glycosyltransferase